MYRKTFSLKIIFLTFAFVISFGICFASEENNTVQSENKNNQELLEVINECVNEIKIDLRDIDNTLNKLDSTEEYEKYPAIRLNIDTPFFGLSSMVDQKLKIKNDVSTVDVAKGYSIKDVVNNMSIKLPDIKIGNIVVSTKDIKLDDSISESDAKIAITKLIQYISQVENTDELLDKRINNIFEGYIPKEKLDKIDSLKEKLNNISSNLISKDDDILTISLINNDENSKSIVTKYYDINDRVYDYKIAVNNVLLSKEELDDLETKSVSLELEGLNFLKEVNLEKEKVVQNYDINTLLNNTSNILNEKKKALDEYVLGSTTSSIVSVENENGEEVSSDTSVDVTNYTVTSKYIIDYEQNLLNSLNEKIKYYSLDNAEENNEIREISSDEKNSLLQDILRLYKDFEVKENKFYLDNLNYILRDTTYKLSKLPEYANSTTSKDVKYIYITLPNDMDKLLEKYDTKSLMQTEMLTKELSNRLLKLVNSNVSVNMEYNKFNLS